MFENLKNKTNLSVHCKDNFTIYWTTKGIGFGTLYFYQTEDGKWHCNNELMSKEFIKKQFDAFVDSVELMEPR